ncbi:hypothetical protein E2C01_030140 [Portunus trituberculatus]|uniref:Uncharacterized protein n=1 Tax=Portunus trituberculatus TaxID=210409 RepID=A0A5B7EUX3_PORTR|nr:hypothetical protein [Portunus trituberculatus]
MFRELRRKSLQLERGALDKFRSERRGSLTDKTEKPTPPTNYHHAHNHHHHHLHHPHHPHHDKSERRGSLVARFGGLG